MIEKVILPIFIGVLVGLALLYGPEFKEFFSPERQLSYEVHESKSILSTDAIGTKDIPIFGKKVDEIFLTQIIVKNTGSKQIDDANFVLKATPENKLDLFQFFYTTEPQILFGKINFRNMQNKLVKQIEIKKFVENNSFTASFITSDKLNVEFVSNMPQTDIVKNEYNKQKEDLTYIAALSAVAVLLGRFLIDIMNFFIRKVRSTKSS